jgi:hypothetical protein
MHTKSIFNELGLLGKLTTSKNLTQRNINKQQNREKKSMQKIEPPKTM